MIDGRKLRLYRFLLQMGRITLDDVPEEYRDQVIADGNVG